MVDQAGHEPAPVAAALPRRPRRDPLRFSRQRCAKRSSAAIVALQAWSANWHESDTGDLIEALDADFAARRFVNCSVAEFDFTALTEVEDTVREEILEEPCPPKPWPTGVRDLDPTTGAHP